MANCLEIKAFCDMLSKDILLLVEIGYVSHSKTIKTYCMEVGHIGCYLSKRPHTTGRAGEIFHNFSLPLPAFYKGGSG